MFVNLINHSNYSLIISSIKIDDIISFSLRENNKYAALVDIGNLYGTIEFYNKAIKNNLIPIIGVQITYNNAKYVLIAKNIDGLKNINNIVSYLSTNPPSLNIANYLLHVYVIAINDNINIDWKNVCEEYFTINGENPIAAKENYCEKKEDAQILAALSAIRSGTTLLESPNDTNYEYLHCLSQAEAKKTFSDVQLNNLERLVSSINLEIKQDNKINFIKFNPDHDSRTLLANMCKEGLTKKLGDNVDINYIKRLKTELDVIDKMNFNDYFLVVQDYVRWAHEHDVLVGPGRGSAAGSLVAYVLNITGIDPIKNNLIFERFLNIDRKTMPDIDIDFDDVRRDDVVNYLVTKYGQDKVAHIITFQRMKSKMAIRDVGRILGIDLAIITKISKLFTMEYEDDIALGIEKEKEIKDYYKQFPRLFDIASRIVTFPRQIGLHAAGIVVSESALGSIVPVQLTSDGSLVTQYSMEYIEPLGLIKMDLLSLSNLSTIKEIISLIKKDKNIDLNIYDLSIDDEGVFNQLAKGDTVGIFQLESQGMKNTIMKIKPKTVEDISITLALFRPGPMENIPTYLANKAKPESIVYMNELFKKVLAPTYNVIVYQEQLMEIVRGVANYSYAQADIFRRIISKKKIEELNKLEIEFKEAAASNGYSQEQADEIYKYIYAFANYGFNHSHSLAYSYITYWMAYLKFKYPLEFFTVLLSSNGNSADKIALYFDDAKNNNIKILPPSITKSIYNFSVKNGAVVFGLNAIKGIGNEIINKILNVRNTNNFTSYTQAMMLLAKNGVGIKTIETLIKAGCFDELLNGKTRFYLIKNLEEIFTKSKTATTDGKVLIQPKLINVVPTTDDIELLSQEQFNLLGVNFSKGSFDKLVKDYTGGFDLETLIDATSKPIGQVSHILVKILKYREIKTKTGAAMAFAKISDDSKNMDLTIFPGVYANAASILKNDNLYIITVKNDVRGLQALNIREYK